MNGQHVKDLMLKLSEGCFCEAQVPLEMAPETAFDVGISLICPACGGTDGRVEQAEEGVRVARCPCGCEFCPPMDSIAKRVVESVVESERHRRHILDIPTARHKAKKRERTGSVGASRELAHKLLTT